MMTESVSDLLPVILHVGSVAAVPIAGICAEDDHVLLAGIVYGDRSIQDVRQQDLDFRQLLLHVAKIHRRAGERDDDAAHRKPRQNRLHRLSFRLDPAGIVGGSAEPMVPSVP